MSPETNMKTTCQGICKQCHKQRNMPWLEMDSKRWNGTDPFPRYGKEGFVICKFIDHKGAVIEDYPPPQCRYITEITLVMQDDDNHPTTAHI